MKANSRLHNNQSKRLHLLNPSIKRLPKSPNTPRFICAFVWPLIFAPHRLALIRVLDRTVEVQPLVVIRFAHRDVLLEALVASRAVAVHETDRVLAVLGEVKELAAQVSEMRHFGLGGEPRKFEVEEAKVSASNVQCVRYGLLLRVC